MWNEALLNDSKNLLEKHPAVLEMYFNCSEIVLKKRVTNHPVISYLAASTGKIHACKVIYICGVSLCFCMPVKFNVNFNVKIHCYIK